MRTIVPFFTDYIIDINNTLTDNEKNLNVVMSMYISYRVEGQPYKKVYINFQKDDLIDENNCVDINNPISLKLNT